MHTHTYILTYIHTYCLPAEMVHVRVNADWVLRDLSPDLNDAWRDTQTHVSMNLTHPMGLPHLKNDTHFNGANENEINNYFAL